MKTNLIKISIFRDGGTSVWIEPGVKDSIKTIKDFQNCTKYYLDNRIFSDTKGELYNKHPDSKNAKILDKTNFNFIDNERNNNQ